MVGHAPTIELQPQSQWEIGGDVSRKSTTCEMVNSRSRLGMRSSMRKNTRLIVFMLASAVGMSAALAPSLSVAGSPRWEGIHLVRLVFEKNSNATINSSYYHEIRTGTLTFDKEFRHPSIPAAPAPVDCASTERVGLTFLAKRSTSFRAKNVKLRYEWTHSSVQAGHSPVVYYRTRVFLREEKAKLFSSRIRLTQKFRVDGVLSVEVSIGKNTIARDSFRLSGCLDSDSTDRE